ncbi:MAG TPA: hypothetical protein VFX02_08855 [Gammaproteobacteria bacterium]|nr:hypothetical protein [Gammaproteobacteria bacterium]
MSLIENFKEGLRIKRLTQAKNEKEKAAALLELAETPSERVYPYLLQALSPDLHVGVFRTISEALAGYGSKEPLVPVIRTWVKLKSYIGDPPIPLKDIIPVLARLDSDWKRSPELQKLTPEILAVAKGNVDGRISHAIELLLVLRLIDLASLYKLADEAGAERGLAVFSAVLNAYVQFGYGKAIPELVKLFWKFRERKVGKNQAFGASLNFVLQAIAKLAKTENASVILARDIEGALFEEEAAMAVLEAFGLRRKAHDLMLAVHKEFKEPSAWPAEGWVAETIKSIGANPVETILEAQKLIGRTPHISSDARERVLSGIGFLLQGILKYTSGEARLAAIKAFISACPISAKLVEDARRPGAESSQVAQLVSRGKLLYTVLRSQVLGADHQAASYCLLELVRLKDLLNAPPFNCWDAQVNAAVEKYKASL